MNQVEVTTPTEKVAGFIKLRTNHGVSLLKVIATPEVIREIQNHIRWLEEMVKEKK